MNVKTTMESREKIVFQASPYSHTELKKVMSLDVRKFLDVAHWASNRQIQIGVRGYYRERYTTLENLLKRWSDKGKIRSCKIGSTKYYAKLGKTRDFDIHDTSNVPHGYAVTEDLVRLMTAKEGEPLAQRLFRGYYRVPEFGIRYENGKMILVEHSTENDTEYHQRLSGKLTGYGKSIEKIEEDFGVKVLVLFILDVKRERVKQLINKYKPEGNYFFTDYQTFLSIPMGQALIAPIYLWKDLKERPLIK